MKAIVCGAVVGLVWVVVGVPLAPVAEVLAVLAEPVTIAFAAGLVARPYVRRSRRWMA
ncbi:hypothetical protein [Streptomyces europaeiscabiei]|uniref:hypothetical protein n=1 Tax=Streptomyces europaeiscabiei TaxID=146819 RepID=UPI002E0FCADC|nr:hypothetical protein OHB30_10845 [Streptomyces europaeiscabiei]